MNWCKENNEQKTYSKKDIEWLRKRVEKFESLKSMQSEIKDATNHIRIDNESLNKSKELNDTNNKRAAIMKN